MDIDLYSESGELSQDVLEKTKYRLFMSHAFTGLPTLNLVMEKVEGILEKEGYVGLICLTIERGDRIEKAYGWQLYDVCILTIARALKALVGRQLRKDDILAIGQEHDDTFLIFLSGKKSPGKLTLDRLESIARRIKSPLEKEVNAALRDQVRGRVSLCVGFTLLHQSARVRLERMLYRSIGKSYSVQGSHRDGIVTDRSGRILQIIRSQSVEPYFQPIVDMVSGEIYGYEALARGPKNTTFEQPLTLFGSAVEAGLVCDLDRLCIDKAWRQARLLDKGRRIFLNIHPETVTDPAFPALLDAEWDGADVGNVVLELTERMGMADCECIRRHLQPFRERGIKIAVDNTCAGLSSIEWMAELKPDFIKIDLSLVRGMHRDPVRQSLIATLVQTARQFGVGLIAEGVESRGEFDALRALQIELGQGYFFGKPAPTFSAAPPRNPHA